MPDDPAMQLHYWRARFARLFNYLDEELEDDLLYVDILTMIERDAVTRRALRSPHEIREPVTDADDAVSRARLRRELQ